MADWFDELYQDRARFGLKLKRSLYHAKSAFQTIDIFETEQFGTALALDGVFQTSVGDEFHYHEMLVHTALTTAPRIDNVLIIGGGDGGTAREVLSYPEVKRVVMCELDEMVVRACQEHLTAFQVPWDDPRLQLRFADGIAFLGDHAGDSFDVILVDGPDPVGPAEGLFRSPFYESCRDRLADHGVLCVQSESPQLMRDEFVRIVRTLRGVFERADPFFAPVPIYMSGSWSFTHAAQRVDPLNINDARARRVEASARYYNRDVHRAAFAQPTGIRKLLES